MPKAKSSWFSVLLIIAALAIWAFQQKERGSPAMPPPTAAAAGTVGGYEHFQNCTLARARNNDGDSFLIRLPDGRESEFRLYFVDTPESAFKTYGGGESNHERIRQQAAEMGGITPEQAVEIGKQGKAFTLGLLESAPFAIFTEWDSPFNDRRYHAFVEVRQGGKSRWLDELLIERGLARIRTKPADLPDGTAASSHREHLRSLEREARRGGRGVWGL